MCYDSKIKPIPLYLLKMELFQDHGLKRHWRYTLMSNITIFDLQISA